MRLRIPGRAADPIGELAGGSTSPRKKRRPASLAPAVSDGRVDGEDVGLFRQLIDDVQDAADLLGAFAQHQHVRDDAGPPVASTCSTVSRAPRTVCGRRRARRSGAGGDAGDARCALGDLAGRYQLDNMVVATSVAGGLTFGAFVCCPAAAQAQRRAANVLHRGADSYLRLRLIRITAT